jgi:hypothetical protein
VLGHGGQLGVGLPVALPAVAGVAVPNQAHTAHSGAVQDGAQAAVVAARQLILGPVAGTLVILAPAVSDQRSQHAVAHRRKRRLILEQEERASGDGATWSRRRGHAGLSGVVSFPGV